LNIRTSWFIQPITGFVLNKPQYQIKLFGGEAIKIFYLYSQMQLEAAKHVGILFLLLVITNEPF
jgi:hypothetical protein